jgi:LuxR family maltose regulon positive regulatory protein
VLETHATSNDAPFQCGEYILACREYQNAEVVRAEAESSTEMEKPIASEDQRTPPIPIRALHLAPPSYAFSAVPTKALERIETSKPVQVTLVAAPTGYGKTILLSEIYRRAVSLGQRCFWVGLDAHDGHEVSLIDGIMQHLVGEHDQIPDALDYRRRPPVRQRVDLILEHLAGIKPPATVFLDNADLGQTNETRELVNALIFDPRSVCNLVISTSTEPPFDTARALLELRLLPIGPRELSFGPEEINALFREAGTPPLAPDDASKILAHSEGWPAAVRLIQVLLSTSGRTLTDAGGLPRESERLSDSLFDDLLKRLPGDLCHFLAETSIFSTFSSELLAFATRSDKAHEFLQYLVDNKILIVSVDEHGSWHRFHTLFKRYLVRRRPQLLDHAHLLEVMRRGAQWLERNDSIEAGLELAVEAADQALAVRLLEKLSWSLVRSRGYLPTFIGWADKVSHLGCELGDEATFWFAWALIFERRYDEASIRLQELNQRLEGNSTAPRNKTKLGAKARLAEIVLKLHMDDLKSVQQLAPAWLERFAGDDPFEHGATAGALALALLAEHQFTAAHSAARTSLTAVAPTTSLYGRVWASNISAAIAIASCNADRVDDALAKLEHEIRADLDDDSLMAAVTSTVRARALYDKGNTVEAFALAEQSLPLVRSCGMLDFVWLGFEVMIAIAVESGRYTSQLSELYEIAAEYPKRLSILIDLLLIRLFCNTGRVREAQELGERLGIWSTTGNFILPADFVFESERAAGRFAGIALMTANGYLKEADELIKQELAVARRSSRRGAVVELNLAEAAVHMKRGEHRNVVRAFSRAINSGVECNSFRPFFEQKSLVAHLISVCAIKDLGLARDSARQFLDHVARIVKSREDTADNDLEMVVDPLTKRELELLRMLDAGLDNAQISGNSGIAVRTVKWHLHNLYAKLAVKNRTSAIARARQLKIL